MDERMLEMLRWIIIIVDVIIMIMTKRFADDDDTRMLHAMCGVWAVGASGGKCCTSFSLE